MQTEGFLLKISAGHQGVSLNSQHNNEFICIKTTGRFLTKMATTTHEVDPQGDLLLVLHTHHCNANSAMHVAGAWAGIVGSEVATRTTEPALEGKYTFQFFRKMERVQLPCD